MSAWPSRQGRPKLSAITTAGELPDAAAISPRIRRAEASVSTGRSETWPPRRLEVSIPAFAQIQPDLVSVIRTPRSARTTRSLSASTSSTRAGSLPSRAASSRARTPGSTPLNSRTRPSALETTFWEMTTISSPAGDPASAIRRPRSSPARSSGRPSTGLIRSSRAGKAESGCGGLHTLAQLPEDPCGPRRRLRVEEQLVAQEGEVLGRVEVDGDRLELLEREADSRGARTAHVPRAAVRAEGREEDIGRREDQCIGARAVMIRDDQSRSR